MSKTGDEPPSAFREADHVLEECPSCQRETPHVVTIEIREESADPKASAYSREPYRVSICERCETSEQLRMNDQ